MDKTRIRFLITGEVQGVGFRYRARYAASAFGITGWVRNEWDGSVVMEAQGTGEALDELIEAIGRGIYVRIESIRKETLPLDPDESGFYIVD